MVKETDREKEMRGGRGGGGLEREREIGGVRVEEWGQNVCFMV